MQRINQWIIEETEAESLNILLEGKTKKKENERLVSSSPDAKLVFMLTTRWPLWLWSALLFLSSLSLAYSS